MSTQTTNILLVDDEMPIRMTLSDLLRRRGVDVATAANGQEALDLIYQRPFAVMVFDLKMPGMSGIELAQRAHQRQPDAAIIILTGHGSLDSAIEGIHLGVFDYMLKTTPPREVVDRVMAAAEKRSQDLRERHLIQAVRAAVADLNEEAPAPAQNPTDNWIVIGDLHISTWKQTARLGEQTLSLTPTEFRVLACLAQQAGQVMSYQEIVRCAQSYDAKSVEAAELIKPHIYHLRQKIEPDPSSPRYILTVRGTGYLLALPPTP